MPRRRSTARASRAPGPAAAIPLELLAGPCIEVWNDRANADWTSRAASAFRRYHDARHAWLAAHGIGRYDRESVPPELESGSIRVTPWSFEYLAVQRPDDLARKLRRLGLPPDWKPTHVGSYDYGRPA